MVSFIAGGDPKVLSEYIVKNRGIIPTSAKDALLNYKQVQLRELHSRGCSKADQRIQYPANSKSTPSKAGTLE